MGHLRSLLVVVGAMAVAGSACGGGGGSGSADPTTTSRSEPTTTTAAPATIDLSEPIPGGSLHGTPRPPLENTGDDYVAIFESIDATFRWLSENPDVSVLDELYVPGTRTHQFQVELFTELVNNEWRAADDGYRLVSAEVTDVQPGLVSLRVSDSMDFERIVDVNGAQVGEGRPRDPQVKTWTVLLQADAAGAWRVADWSELPAQEVEV